MPHGGRGSIVRRKMRRAEKKAAQARERELTAAAGAGSVLLSFPTPMTYVASCEMGVASSPMAFAQRPMNSMPDFNGFGMRASSESNPMVELVPMQLMQFVGPSASPTVRVESASSGPQTPPYMVSPRTSMNMLPTQIPTAGLMPEPYAASPCSSMTGLPQIYFQQGPQLQVPSGPFYAQNSPTVGAQCPMAAATDCSPRDNSEHARTLMVPYAACESTGRSVGWDLSVEESEESEAALSSKRLMRPMLESRQTAVSESEFMTPIATQPAPPTFFAEADTPRRLAEEMEFGDVDLHVKNTFVNVETQMEPSPRDSRRFSAPAW